MSEDQCTLMLPMKSSILPFDLFVLGPAVVHFVCHGTR